MRRIDSRVAHRRPELSQHYLRDAGVARALVRRLRLPPGALVVEPGAGDGILTEALCDAGFRAVAIEKDPQLHAALRLRFAGRPNAACIRADFLDFLLPATPYCAVSNVPYGITAAVVRKLLHAARPPDVAMLIVQREAAEKFAGSPQETLFSLLHKPRFDITIAGAVSRRDFAPPPRVQSALLRMERRDVPLIGARAAPRYRALVEAAFTYGLRPALRRDLTARQIKRLARDHGFAADARPSQLNFDQWLAIFRFVEHECLGHDPTLSRGAAASPAVATEEPQNYADFTDARRRQHNGGMNQLPRLGALVAAFALAIAGGIYLADRNTRSSHEFAFVMRDVCPGDDPQYSGCSSIYIAQAEAVWPSLRYQDPRALPPGTRKVLTRTERMTGVTWSPDGLQLAYLTAEINVACTPRYFCEPLIYDQWVINADGSDNRETNADVRFHELVDPPVGRVDGALVDGKTVSPDGKLIAFNASPGDPGSRIDADSICVTSGGLDARSRRCFGHGGFGTPVWNPTSPTNR